MTESEILNCVEGVKRDGNSEDMAKLIKQFDKAIAGLASKIDKHHYEDAVQDGYMGLFLAARNYNSSKNVKFFTYAYAYIRGYIFKGARSRYGVHINSYENLTELLDNPDFASILMPLSIESIAYAGRGEWAFFGEEDHDIENFEENLFRSQVSGLVKNELERMPFHARLVTDENGEPAIMRTPESERQNIRKVASLYFGLEENSSPKTIGTIAKEMDISYDETKRLLKLAYAGLREREEVNNLREFAG